MSRTEVVNVRNLPPSWRGDPAYAYCGRASRGFAGRWGNPHAVGWCARCQARHDRDDAVDLHAQETRARYRLDPAFRAELESLRGRKLVCFCAPARCHCDVYVELLECRGDSPLNAADPFPLGWGSGRYRFRLSGEAGWQDALVELRERDSNQYGVATVGGKQVFLRELAGEWRRY